MKKLPYPLSLIPYTLYSIPYTLYSIPYTLYLIPYTLYLLSSCNNVPNSPGWEFMPDMNRSSSYETNSSNSIYSDR